MQALHVEVSANYRDASRACTPSGHNIQCQAAHSADLPAQPAAYTINEGVQNKCHV
jgi:hypothetical protein